MAIFLVQHGKSLSKEVDPERDYQNRGRRIQHALRIRPDIMAYLSLVLITAGKGVLFKQQRFLPPRLILKAA